MSSGRTLQRLEVDLFKVPLPVALSDSTHGLMEHFELITVRLADDEGADGLGYTYTVGAGGGAVASLIDRDLRHVIEGADPTRIEQIWERMWWALHFTGRGGAASFAIAAVDTALHDLAAKRAGLPLWRHLGGHDPKVQAYAGGIDLDFPLEQLLDQTRANLDKGFRAIKMKVGRARLTEDVERVAAMRELLGPGFPLMVDANMRWRIDQAVAAARALQPFGLVWLEEPTIPDDPTGHVRISEQGGLPIATGENFHT
ncbi:MAG: mandelate racemase/muconate lactonizing enzyme family protein, partial [Geminicoccaceae bacterium]|nr:mandelate racemase/muconate lactonizing enzyme family protein [Geminicoccaceae bacterium]